MWQSLLFSFCDLGRGLKSVSENAGLDAASPALTNRAVRATHLVVPIEHNRVASSNGL